MNRRRDPGRARKGPEAACDHGLTHSTQQRLLPSGALFLPQYPSEDTYHPPSLASLSAPVPTLCEKVPPSTQIQRTLWTFPDATPPAQISWVEALRLQQFQDHVLPRPGKSNENTGLRPVRAWGLRILASRLVQQVWAVPHTHFPTQQQAQGPQNTTRQSLQTNFCGAKGQATSQTIHLSGTKPMPRIIWHFGQQLSFPPCSSRNHASSQVGRAQPYNLGRGWGKHHPHGQHKPSSSQGWLVPEKNSETLKNKEADP